MPVEKAMYLGRPKPPHDQRGAGIPGLFVLSSSTEENELFCDGGIGDEAFFFAREAFIIEPVEGVEKQPDTAKKAMLARMLGSRQWWLSSPSVASPP